MCGTINKNETNMLMWFIVCWRVQSRTATSLKLTELETRVKVASNHANHTYMFVHTIPTSRSHTQSNPVMMEQPMIDGGTDGFYTEQVLFLSCRSRWPKERKILIH